jgi:hypothetical protein
MMHLNAAIAMPKQLSMEARNSLVLSGKRAMVKRKRQPNWRWWPPTTILVVFSQPKPLGRIEGAIKKNESPGRSRVSIKYSLATLSRRCPSQ